MSDAASSDLLALVQVHYQDLLRLLTRRLGCASLAADVVQDLCVRLRELGGDASAAIANPRAYLFRMAGNLATDHQRRARAIRRHLSPDPVPDALACDRPTADDVLHQRQRLLALRAAIDALPPRCREVFLLHRFTGLSHPEIARRLGISVSMVEKHVQRAMAQCRDHLRRLDG